MFDITFLFLEGKFTYPSFDKGEGEWKALRLNCETRRLWTLRFLWILFWGPFDTVVASVPASFKSITSYLICRLTGKGYVVWDETWYIPFTRSRRNWLYRKIRQAQYKYILKHSDAVVVHGQQSREFHLSLGVSAEKIFIANHSSIDLLEFQPESRQGTPRRSPSGT